MAGLPVTIRLARPRRCTSSCRRSRRPPTSAMRRRDQGRLSESNPMLGTTRLPPRCPVAGDLRDPGACGSRRAAKAVQERGTGEGPARRDHASARRLSRRSCVGWRELTEHVMAEEARPSLELPLRHDDRGAAGLPPARRRGSPRVADFFSFGHETTLTQMDARHVHADDAEGKFLTFYLEGRSARNRNPFENARTRAGGRRPDANRASNAVALRSPDIKLGICGEPRPAEAEVRSSSCPRASVSTT